MVPTNRLRQVPVFVPDSAYCTGYKLQQWWSEHGKGPGDTFHKESTKDVVCLSPTGESSMLTIPTMLEMPEIGEWRDVEVVQE